MKRTSLRLLPLALLLSLPIAAHASNDEACRALVDPMTTIMATLRRDAPLTETQQAQWQTWNVACTARAWQAALKDPGQAPIAAHKLPGSFSPAPNIAPRRSYMVGGTAERFTPRVTYPTTSCMTSYTSHKGGGSYYTTCTTY